MMTIVMIDWASFGGFSLKQFVDGSKFLSVHDAFIIHVHDGLHREGDRDGIVCSDC